MTAVPVRPETPASQLRIGVFGGAFDPPHKAHVALAQAAVRYLSLDTLHIMPTGLAWHKTRVLSSPAHRLAMTRLAFEGLPHLLVDDCELKRAGPTFTIETLETLQAKNPQAQLYLVMGADQFAAFGEWHRWEAILKLAIICIAGRAHHMSAENQFDAYIEQKHRFSVLPLPFMAVSATQIRQLFANGDAKPAAINDLVPDSVARYIALHKLYSPP